MLQFYRETAKKKPAHAEQTMQTVQKYTQVFRLLAVSKRAAACCAHVSCVMLGGLPACLLPSPPLPLFSGLSLHASSMRMQR